MGTVLAEENGVQFVADNSYYIKTPLSSFPKTLETWVLFPSDLVSVRSGVVFGNYLNGASPCVNFEFNYGRTPRLYIVDNNKKTYDYVFSDVSVPEQEWVHVALTVDAANDTLSCYINGVKAKSITDENIPTSVDFVLTHALGSDKRTGAESMAFKGKIKDIKIYSDIRTDSEIASDYSSSKTDTDNLMVHYDLSGYTGIPKVFTDSSGNGYDAHLSEWIKKKPFTGEYAYSFAVIGDTQTLASNEPRHFLGIYEWLAKNANDINLKFVFGLGDITDKSNKHELALAKASMQILDKTVPYSIIRGDHDVTSKFKATFPHSEYSNKISGSYDASMLNTYQKLNIGNTQYLMLNLDFGPNDDVLEWASNVIEANPNHNVIVSTHAYLGSDGYPLESTDNEAPTTLGGSNDGDDIWEKLISKHENIVLVLSGHIASDDIIVSTATGDNGNTVTQMLINPELLDIALGGNGMAAILYFSEDGKTVNVEYYSTSRDAYYLDKNQFQFTLDTVDSDFIAPDTAPDGISATLSLTADEYDGRIFAALYSNDGKITEVKTYNAAPSVEVEFEGAPEDSYIKLMWWNGNSLVPLTEKTTNINLIVK